MPEAAPCVPVSEVGCTSHYDDAVLALFQARLFKDAKEFLWTVHCAPLFCGFESHRFPVRICDLVRELMSKRAIHATFCDSKSQLEAVRVDVHRDNEEVHAPAVFELRVEKGSD